jgi:glycosyltransferase involved in cell wall biosynthesis
MRIGIDCRAIQNRGRGEQSGIGYYTYHLVKNLLEIDRENKYILFFDKQFHQAKEFKELGAEVRSFPFYQYREYLPVAYSQMLVSAFLDREKLDIYHSTAYVIPMFYNKPSVVTVHDLAVYKYPEFFPKTFLSRQVFSTKVLTPQSLNKAKKIIAISSNTKKDIIEEFEIPEERIEVVYEGVINHDHEDYHDPFEFKSLRNKYGLSDKYLMFLGTVEQRKNLVGLINAFRDLRMIPDSPIQDYQLIIAGMDGWNSEEVYKAISEANASLARLDARRSGKERRSGRDTRSAKKIESQGERRSGIDRRQVGPIKHIGYVPHDDKFPLIANAACFIFPSLYEGFGLPVLEAMSIGTPVITSKAGSLPEVTGDHGALLVDPLKENEMIDAIIQIVTDVGLKEELTLVGRERSKEFTWQKCAKETLAIYKSLKID